MERESLCAAVELHLSIRELALKFEVSGATVRYWLRVHGLKTYKGPRGKLPKDHQLKRRCGCGATNPTEFYGNVTGTCKRCHVKACAKRGSETRAKAIELLGGKCSQCSFVGPSAVFDVHHLDPASKDPNFATWRSWTWKRVEAELKGCVLLCKNCHAMEHAEIRLG